MKDQTYVAPSRQDKSSLTVWLDQEFKHKIKQAALDKRITLQELIEKSLHKTLEEMRG